jgi:hypothetical protein
MSDIKSQVAHLIISLFVLQTEVLLSSLFITLLISTLLSKEVSKIVIF